MGMQQRHGHTAWTRTWRMDNDMDMHWYGHEAWTWTCSTDMGTKHRLGHANLDNGYAPWSWTCTMGTGIKRLIWHRCIFFC
jgi:hypothetical protein